MASRTIRDILEGQRLVTVQVSMSVNEAAAVMKKHLMGAI
jgi:hypothetical protein